MDDLLQLAGLALASAAAGAVNAVAGGGTLLTFPALMGLGLDAVAANATSTMGLVFGTAGSVVGYRRELAGPGARAWLAWILPASVAGGGVGAWLLVRTPAGLFARVVPFLILGATLLFIARERIAARAGEGPPPRPVSERSAAEKALVLAAIFPIAVYCGYFGAGAGILTLAALGALGAGTIHEANALKGLGNGASNVVATAVFVAGGLIAWREAAVIVVASALGGWLGADRARRLGAHVVRRAVVAIGLAAAAWTAWRAL